MILMGCNYDDRCYRISMDYRGYSQTIEKDLSDGMNDINEIMYLLGEYDIPDDYLGYKVRENIKKINEILTDDTVEINNVKTDIKNFANEKANMHMEHYYDWKERQLALEKKNQEEQLED